MRATCTWGDGPDVILTIDGERFILYEDPQHIEPTKGDFKHGFVRKGSTDLTADEAEALGHQLINAAAQARGLDKLCEDHDKQAVLDELERPPIPKEDLTCHTCKDKDICRYAYDHYNTNGDCLAMK